MFKSYLAKLFDEHMQEVMKGASAALAIRIFGTLLGFAVSVLVARLLGAEGSGIYFLAFSVITIAAMIGRVGFDNTLIRFIASHASANEWIDVRFAYHIAIKVVTASSLLVSVVLYCGSSWLSNSLFGKPFMEIPLQLSAVAVLPLALATIHAISLRGLKRIAASQFIQTAFISLVALVILYPLIRLWGANGAIFAYLAAVIITSFVAWGLWRNALSSKMKLERQGPKTLTLTSLFQSSWPLFGVALMGLVMQQAATVFLGVWDTVDSVGVYSVASRIAGLLLFPLFAMISILAPKFAEMHRQNDIKGLMQLARTSSKVLIFLSMPMAAIVPMGAEWALSLFGPGFQNGALVLDVLLIGVVINTSTGAVGELLMMSGQEKIVRLGMAYGAFICLALCLILIPKYGQIGAAISVSGGMSIQNIFMLVMVKIRFGTWPIPTLIKYKRSHI